MATVEQLFEALKAADEAGNEEDARKLAEMIKQVQSSAGPLRYQDENPEESIDEDYLRADPNFVAASKRIYRLNEGKEFEGSDEDAANYGIDEMGWFNYNITQMSVKANTLQGVSQEDKEAFLYLMEAYDDLGISWGGTWRFARGVLTDPTTYVGLTTFGVGTVASQGGKALTKEGIKGLLKAGLRGATIAGTESAIYGGLDQKMRQDVEIQAGVRDDYDLGQIGQSALISGGVGALTGGAIDAGVMKIRQGAAKKASGDLIEETEEVLGTATPDTPQKTPETPSETPTATLKPAANDNVVPAAANDNPTTFPVQDFNKPKPVDELADDLANQNLSQQKPVEAAQITLENITQAVKSFPKDRAIGVREGVQSLQQLRNATRGLGQLLESASKQGVDFVEHVQTMEVTAKQLQSLKNSSQQATDSLKRQLAKVVKEKGETTDAATLTQLQKQQDELEDSLAITEQVDLSFATQSGRDLRMRDEGLNAGEMLGVTPKSIMEKRGISRAEAEEEYLRLVDKREEYLKSAREMQEVEARINKAVQEGDFAEAIKQWGRKKSIKRTHNKITANDSLGAKAYKSFSNAMDLVAELMISFVFSPSTLIVNVVPSGVLTLVRPALDTIASRPYSRAAWRQAGATYSAMASAIPSAFKAGRLAWKYERSLLMNDTSRLLEVTPVIPKRYLGGVIRLFPRIVQATDEVFSQIAYRGYTMGHLTAQAMEEGMAKGLKGKKLDKYVKDQVKDHAERIYSKDPEKDVGIVKMLMEQAEDRGLYGAHAEAWVKKELAENSNLLRQAESEAGRNYVEDLLFKRAFTGDGHISKAAQWYERTVRKHPLLRVMGQLFFRTPVRVFEAGIRLTPGLNLISPRFMDDLRGKNGLARQVRAQGEALMSYAYAGTVLSLYASGNITGAGPTDYQQRRQGENTDDFEPYTITFPNGDKWSYRNVDPIATPLKIMVNALERLEVLEYRRAQGEMVGEKDFNVAMAYFQVATGAVAQAIRDASLTQGIDEILEVGEMMMAEGDAQARFVQYLGSKLNMAVPNTSYKIQLLEDPIMNDPATLDQYWASRVNPQDPKVPRMFTATGRPRRLSNPEAGLIVFSPSTEKERKRGVPEKELEVEEALWELTQVTDTSFQAPYTHRLIGDGKTDLRTTMTQDGQEPLYNRWMRYTHESNMIDELHSVLVEMDLPDGTPSAKGPRYEAAKKIINAYRDAAIVRLWSEETGLEQSYVEHKLLEASLKAGQRDQQRLPF